MPNSPPPSRPPRYAARFEGGPRHGTTRQLRALPSGEPPDFVPALVECAGVYALAGAVDAEGRLPYSRMPWERADTLQRTQPPPQPPGTPPRPRDRGRRN